MNATNLMFHRDGEYTEDPVLEGGKGGGRADVIAGRRYDAIPRPETIGRVTLWENGGKTAHQWCVAGSARMDQG
jgi:hypothetical protein